MGTGKFRAAVAILAFAGVATAALLAQSAPAPARDPLLDEIRALRADMNQRLEATMTLRTGSTATPTTSSSLVLSP